MHPQAKTTWYHLPTLGLLFLSYVVYAYQNIRQEPVLLPLSVFKWTQLPIIVIGFVHVHKEGHPNYDFIDWTRE